MQRGPRLYNALSDEERLARLRRKAARKEKEVHRVRRNRIVACFAIAILIFGLQLIMVHVQTGRINSQIQTNKTELNQVNKTNKKYVISSTILNLANQYILFLIKRRIISEISNWIKT